MMSEYMYYRYRQKPSFKHGVNGSAVPLDVVYLALEIDLPILSYSVASVRKYLKHPLGTIYVVSPESDTMRAFCRQHRCHWIDETAVLGIGKASIPITIGDLDRSGWMLQQFIKLSVDKFTSNRFVYVLDADTLLVSPQVFEMGGKIIFLVSEEYHRPYYEAYRRLLGYSTTKPFSFIAHQMVFDTEKLAELRAEIQNIHPGKTWYRTILDICDRRKRSPFSEYETYANWMSRCHADEISFEYCYNRGVPRNELEQLPGYAEMGQGKLRSLSCHAWDV